MNTSLLSSLIIVFVTFGILLTVTLIWIKYPPSYINPTYGYRTSRSMKNESNWHYANHIAPRLLLYTLPLFVLINVGTLYLTYLDYFQPLVFAGLFVLQLIVLFGYNIYQVERKLKKHSPK